MGRSRTIELLRDVDDLPADDRQFVAALERGLRVLRMFSSAHETLSNGELARGTALSKAVRWRSGMHRCRSSMCARLRARSCKTSLTMPAPVLRCARVTAST